MVSWTRSLGPKISARRLGAGEMAAAAAGTTGYGPGAFLSLSEPEPESESELESSRLIMKLLSLRLLGSTCSIELKPTYSNPFFVSPSR